MAPSAWVIGRWVTVGCGISCPDPPACSGILTWTTQAIGSAWEPKPIRLEAEKCVNSISRAISYLQNIDIDMRFSQIYCPFGGAQRVEIS